jgi:hypothetical protein
MSLKCLLVIGLVSALATALLGCSDVSYNPYVPNNCHRPMGKTIEAGSDSVNNGADWLDAHFENFYH